MYDGLCGNLLCNESLNIWYAVQQKCPAFLTVTEQQLLIWKAIENIISLCKHVLSLDLECGVQICLFPLCVAKRVW